MDNVQDLEKQLNGFHGDQNSKEYRVLDEMLTRNLLALDGIDTANRDDIRELRKDSIKSINSCISILETKAKNPGEDLINLVCSTKLKTQKAKGCN